MMQEVVKGGRDVVAEVVVENVVVLAVVQVAWLVLLIEIEVEIVVVMVVMIVEIVAAQSWMTPKGPVHSRSDNQHPIQPHALIQVTW
jgi:hypothetical protein